MKNDGAKISKEVGSGYTVIHETPVKSSDGQKHDQHTVYRDGNEVKTSDKPARATGEHIHVQPDFNSRLHEAAKPDTSSPNNQKTNVKPKSTTTSGSGWKTGVRCR